MDQLPSDVFVKRGTLCFYVPEYAERSPAACTVTHHVAEGAGGELIFGVRFDQALMPARIIDSVDVETAPLRMVLGSQALEAPRRGSPSASGLKGAVLA